MCTQTNKLLGLTHKQALTYRRIDICELELVLHITQHYLGDHRRYELHCGCGNWWCGNVGLEPTRLAQVPDDGGVELEGEQCPHSRCSAVAARTEEVL